MGVSSGGVVVDSVLSVVDGAVVVVCIGGFDVVKGSDVRNMRTQADGGVRKPNH